MLKVTDISKSFGKKQALKDVSFSLKNNEIAALLGENGAGKSTLLRIMSGYLQADSGDIKLDETDIESQRIQYLQNVGYVQEISALYGDMNVYEFLLFSANLRQLAAEKIVTRIKEVTALLEIQDVLLQKNETLSKGYKKRVELAAVLLAEPPVLLLDEPTEGLDPNQKQSIRQVIKAYSKNHIVIISTHTLEDVEALASKVLLLHKGELQADSTLKKFKQTAQNDLLASFRQVTKN